MPRRERCGQVFIKKAMAGAKALLGGDASARYYFRDNGYCASGMIAFAQVVNLLSESGQPLSELVGPLKRHARSGQRSFQNDDAQGTIKKFAKRYTDGQVSYLDGICVQYEDWWFVVRPCENEPLIRLNVEAKDQGLLEAKLAELCPLLGTPVEEGAGATL